MIDEDGMGVIIVTTQNYNYYLKSKKEDLIAKLQKKGFIIGFEKNRKSK